MRPDPGRAIQERLLAAMTPDERWAVVRRLRERGLALVWQQADAAGPMTEVDRAMFILDRLYPEMPRQHREQIQVDLAAADAAGRSGFPRPTPHEAAG